MHRIQLLKALEGYHTPYPEEAAMVRRTRDFVVKHEDCFDRANRSGHVTVSSWVINQTCTAVVLLHHKKLDMWLQPGGHADGDPDILRVAIKETSEETGLDPECMRLVSDQLFDVDIHAVPARGNEPRHVHYDVRFLIEIDDSIGLPGNDESHEVRWIPLHEVLAYNNLRSIYRMVDKTRRMRRLLCPAS